MKQRLTQILMLLLLSTTMMAGVGGHTRKVLVIGVDGCRADALLQEITLGHCPNMDTLVTHGFYTMDSWHLDITWSGPSWSSIMTGVYHNKHGVTNNNYTGSNFNRYPYFTTHAKEIDSTFKCIEFCEWAPLVNSVYNANWDRSIIGQDGVSQNTGSATSTLIQDPNVDVMFTYFDHVDLTGHSSGFSPTNPAYNQAIDTVDRQIGVVMAALRARPTYAQEDWLVLLTTDHGGIGTGHGGFSYTERHIWWVGYSDRGIHSQVSGPQNANYTNPADPGDYYNAPDTVNLGLQRQSPVQVDIATTALHHIIYNSGIRPDTVSRWNLDGKSWLCEMGLCSDKFATNGVANVEAVFDFRVTSNPSTNGTFIVNCDNYDAKQIQFTVTDMSGRIVKQISEPAVSMTHLLNLSELAKGTYNLTVQSGSKNATRGIVIE